MRTWRSRLAVYFGFSDPPAGEPADQDQPVSLLRRITAVVAGFVGGALVYGLLAGSLWDGVRWALFVLISLELIRLYEHVKRRRRGAP